jgi:hypothetical protein
MEDFHVRGDTITIEREKWLKLKEICQTIQSSAEQLSSHNPELNTFIEKTSSMLQLLSNDQGMLINSSNKRIPAPLQRYTI